MERIIALDLGTKTCGVAISDLLGIIASDLTTIRFEELNYQNLAEEIDKLAKVHKVSKIILGYPKMMNNDEGPSAIRSKEFKKVLEEKNYQVILWDERYSTVMVNKMFTKTGTKIKKRKATVDQKAASLMLQEYLNSQR